MIFKDILKGLIKDRILSFILIFQISLAFIFINLILHNITNIDNGYEDIKSKEGDEINYEIVDQLHHDPKLEQKVFRSEFYFSKLNNFYNDLIKSNNYTYYENIDQQIYIKNFKGGDKFYNDYKYTENVHENGDVIIDGEKFSGIKNKILSKSVIDKYKIKVSDGRILQKKDFEVDSFNKEIPILLGYDFKDIYSIGDEIEGDLHYKNLKLKVIGILEKDSYINQIGSDEVEYLDTYIITPSINITPNINLSNDEDLIFSNFLYLQKTNGIVGIKGNYELSDFISELESLIVKNDIFEYKVNNILKINTDFIKLSSRESIKIIKSIGSVMTVFSIINISLIFICKFIRNKYYYGVMLISGYSKLYVTLNLLAQLLFICIISNLISYFVTIILSNGYINYSSINLIISFIIVSVGGVIPCKIIADADIMSMIKEKD